MLHDLHGRRFEYLRLSLTDVCNFRCSYCLPGGYRKPPHADPLLTPAEIGCLVRAFAWLGVWKVRLTGGEPSVRPEFDEIAACVSAVPGVDRLAVTTNGYRLVERAQRWFDLGIHAINVSMDSLRSERFRAITGHDRLSEIQAGIDACKRAGFESIKVNTVLLKGLNDDELDDFIAFVRDQDIALRFIELMRTNDNPEFFERHHLPARTVTDRLQALGWQPVVRAAGAGPAVEYAHAESSGRIGIIAPYAKDFCSTCNRLRVSATGKLHLCLFGQGGHDLRPWLQGDTEALARHVSGLLAMKAPSHDLLNGNSGATPHLASIGG